MKALRDLWWKDIRLGKIEIATAADFHSLLTQEELALVASLAAQAASSALIQILEAK